MFVLSYTDAQTGEPKEIRIKAAQNVFVVRIPEQPDEHIPALEVNVSSDAVIVATKNRSQLWSQQYVEMIDDARADKALKPDDVEFFANLAD